MPKAILQSVIACSLVVPAAASPTPPWEIVGGWLAFLGDSFGDHWVAYLVGSLAACAVMLLVYVIWDMSLSLLDSNDRLGLLGLMAVLVGPLFVLGLFEGAWYWFDGAWWRGVLHLFRALTGGCLVFAGVILLGAEHLPSRWTVVWWADRLFKRPLAAFRAASGSVGVKHVAWQLDKHQNLLIRLVRPLMSLESALEVYRETRGHLLGPAPDGWQAGRRHQRVSRRAYRAAATLAVAGRWVPVAELLLYVDGQGYLHDFPVAISVLEEHVPREKFTVALRQLLARCLKRPTWTENWLVLIDALISLGLKREVQRAALAAETARVARSMSDFEVQCRVGDVLIQVGDIANATRVYRRIIGFTEDQNELSKVRRALEQLGDAEGAAQANKKWREIEDERDRKRQWEAEAAEREARSRCPRCGGRGYVWAAYDEIDSWDYVHNRTGRPRRIGVTRVRELCPVCGGSGRR